MSKPPSKAVLASGPLVVVTKRTHVSRDHGTDYLECGHHLPAAQDIAGRRYPVRRRCWKYRDITSGKRINCADCVKHDHCPTCGDSGVVRTPEVKQ